MKVFINGDKLKSAVFKRGLTMREVGDGIGYSSSALSLAIRNGYMEEKMANLIDAFGVKKYEFVASASKDTYLTYDEMTDEEKRVYSIINKATYDALYGIMKKFFSEGKR